MPTDNYYEYISESGFASSFEVAVARRKLLQKLNEMGKSVFCDRIPGYSLKIYGISGKIEAFGRNGTHNFECFVYNPINDDFPNTAKDFAILKAREILQNAGIDCEIYAKFAEDSEREKR